MIVMACHNIASERRVIIIIIIMIIIILILHVIFLDGVDLRGTSKKVLEKDFHSVVKQSL